jgi:hypothetical protein
VAWRLASSILGRLPEAIDVSDPVAWAAAASAAQDQSAAPLAVGTLLLGLLWIYSAWDAQRGSRR